MKSDFKAPIEYSMILSEHILPLNDHIGSNIKLEMEGFISICGIIPNKITVSNVEIKPINHFFKVSVTLALLVPLNHLNVF